MTRAERISSGHAVAMPRPASAEAAEWLVASIAVVLLVAGLVL